MAACALALTGCGGGGDGAAAPPVTATVPAPGAGTPQVTNPFQVQSVTGITVSVDNSIVTIQEGEGISFPISIRAAANIGGPIRAAHFDSATLLTAASGIPVAPGELLSTSSVTFSPLKQGDYTTTMYVILCQADAPSCPTMGTSGVDVLYFPIHISVTPKTN